MTTEILTPVGRLVRGNLYDPQTTDAEGRQLVIKNGPNAGQPRVSYFFAIAIPKQGEQHWNQTEWGAKIWAEGLQDFPHADKSPMFAWKITDGDDASLINARGQERKTAPASREGHQGCWVLGFASGNAPTIYSNLSGSLTPLTTDKAVNPGDFIQVYGSVVGNGSQQQPGVYLNHRYVCLRGYGERIVLGVNPNDVGFGDAPLPTGASVTPVSDFTPPAQTATTTPAPTQPAPMPVPTQPIVANSAPAQPVAQLAPVQPAAPAVTPHTAILTPAAVAAPVAKTLKVHPQYNPDGSLTYDQFIQGGWTDEQLKQQGLL